PTDMQPLMAVLMCLSAGKSEINETIYDKRFRYVEELRRMGARITSDGREAEIIGTGKLSAATVRAVDLRAGAAMIVAGLAADGRTEIEDIHHIERGYSDMVGKLRALGARIRKVNYTDV
ncbi:MAG: UDP-N-acetylglucosamine 1-carboxyvinyltransferase, partial [Clostridia bacterium]|nr:UDP-N-acetylglucosamine 1-carboxyvinyltransferase [Clostridia bacterium]